MRVSALGAGPATTVRLRGREHVSRRKAVSTPRAAAVGRAGKRIAIRRSTIGCRAITRVFAVEDGRVHTTAVVRTAVVATARRGREKQDGA